MKTVDIIKQDRNNRLEMLDRSGCKNPKVRMLIQQWKESKDYKIHKAMNRSDS